MFSHKQKETHNAKRNLNRVGAMTTAVKVSKKLTLAFYFSCNNGFLLSQMH